MSTVKLTGNVGNEVTIRDLGIGRLVSFRLLVNRPGLGKTTAPYLDVVAFGSIRNDDRQLLAKGKFVAVEGRFRKRKHTDADEHIIYATEIIVFNVEHDLSKAFFTTNP